MYSASSMLGKARDGNVILPDNQKRYYREIYLQSDHWKNLRKEKLEKNPNCEKCGKSYSLDIHHKEYKGLYDVSISDLQTLCRICHDKEHAKKKFKKIKQDSKLKHLQKEAEIFKSVWEIFHSKSPNLILINWILDSILDINVIKQRPHFSKRNQERHEKYTYHYGKLRSINNYVSIHY